ncbi:MAG: hypothetical protein PWQ96_761 [Clostridia bacterium]|nr:hypothetical protein [Clostridia bacterium]
MTENNLTLLDHLIAVAPVFNAITSADLGILIVDREKVLEYIPALELDLKIKKGDPINDAWAVKKAMDKGERVISEVDTKAHGVPYVAVGYPIYDNEGNLIGGVGVSESLDRKTKILNLANNLNETIQTINGTVQQLGAEAEELSATSQELLSTSHETNQQVKNTDNILQVIRKVADQTNLIGLNAAIEAARVGEQGRGFTVVAEEVRKLATSTSDSTDQIEEIITGIQQAVGQINTGVEQVAQVTGGQAEGISNLGSAVEELKALSENLVAIANELSKDIYKK